MKITVRSCIAIQEHRLTKMLLNSMHFAIIQAWVTTGPFAKQTNLEFFTLSRTSFAFHLKLPEVTQILRRFVDVSFDQIF